MSIDKEGYPYLKEKTATQKNTRVSFGTWPLFSENLFLRFCLTVEM